MAVPKKKTSKSRSRTRKAHDALKVTGCVFSKTTGSVHRPHCIDSEGYYNGRLVITKTTKAAKAPDSAADSSADVALLDSAATPTDSDSATPSAA